MSWECLKALEERMNVEGGDGACEAEPASISRAYTYG